MPAVWTRDKQPPHGLAVHPQDVFCILKCYMSSDMLSQCPVLVYPGVKRQPLEAFVNNVIRHPGIAASVNADRAASLTSLQQFLNTYPQYSRAVQYIRQEAGLSVKTWHSPLRLKFLQDGPRWLNRSQTALGLGPEERRDVHQLQVVWRRELQQQ
jgi:hypothetical protein